MKPYLVSYDLRNPGQDYARLIATLKQLGAAKVLDSQWVLQTTMTAPELAKYLFQFMDNNDRLLVNELTRNWASYNLLLDLNRAA